MSHLSLLATAVLFTGLLVWLVRWAREARERHRAEMYSITAEDLHEIMRSTPDLLLYDVRQPLDLLANSEIIPGAQRIAPRDVLENPSLIPIEKDSVVYCTCPSDKTSRAIADMARSAKFFHVKFLRGGLEAWKAKGYPVEQYEKPFRLDTGS